MPLVTYVPRFSAVRTVAPIGGGQACGAGAFYRSRDVRPGRPAVTPPYATVSERAKPSRQRSGVRGHPGRKVPVRPFEKLAYLPHAAGPHGCARNARRHRRAGARDVPAVPEPIRSPPGLWPEIFQLRHRTELQRGSAGVVAQRVHAARAASVPAGADRRGLARCSPCGARPAAKRCCNGSVDHEVQLVLIRKGRPTIRRCFECGGRGRGRAR